MHGVTLVLLLPVSLRRTRLDGKMTRRRVLADIVFLISQLQLTIVRGSELGIELDIFSYLDIYWSLGYA